MGYGSHYIQSSLFTKSSNLQLPTSLPVMLGIAILGHAFWNGSLTLISFLTSGMDPILILMLDMMWLVILITLLWTFGRFVLAAAME